MLRGKEGQFVKEGSAQAEIRGVKNGEMEGGVVDGSEIEMAGGSYDGGFIGREIFEEGAMRGEIDQDVAIEGRAGCYPSDRDDGMEGGDGFAHASFSADESDFNWHKIGSGPVSTFLEMYSRI